MSEKKRYILETNDNCQRIALIGVCDGLAVMMDTAVDKLQDADKALGEAYQKGFEAGQYEGTKIFQQGYDEGVKAVEEIAYNDGLNEAWETITKIAKMPDGERGKVFGDCWISNILNKFSAPEIINILDGYEPEQDEIKVSDIITDGKINYLVIDITDKSYVALQGTDFEPVYIGKDYIKSYHNLHDSKDMQKIAEEISKAMKEGAE